MMFGVLEAGGCDNLNKIDNVNEWPFNNLHYNLH